MRQKYYIFFLAVVAALGGFLFGFDTAVISGALSPLIRYYGLESQPLWQGWLVSSVVLGCVLGALASGLLADKSGRKGALIVTGILFLTSSLGAAFSTTFNIFIGFRLVAGVAVGIAAMVSPLYIAEVSPVAIRGRLVALNQFALTLGILIAYISNHLVDRIYVQDGSLAGLVEATEIWRIMLGIAVIPSLLFLVLLLFVPESPRFLALQGKEERAKSILSRLNDDQTALVEWYTISQTLNAKDITLRNLFKPPLGKNTFIALYLAIFSQLSGIDLVLHYGPIILEKAGFSFADSLLGQLSFGIVLVLFTILALWKVDTLGRKPLLLLGNAGIFLMLILIGYFFREASFSEIGLLTAISAFVAFFAFSMGPIPWIVMSEIFPAKVRGQAMALATFSLFSANWLVAQLFPLGMEYWGGHRTFWLLALFTLPTFWLVWKIMPETKGKVLESQLSH